MNTKKTIQTATEQIKSKQYYLSLLLQKLSINSQQKDQNQADSLLSNFLSE